MRLLEQHQLVGLSLAPEQAEALAYTRDCIGTDSRDAVRNVVTKLALLDMGKHAFPVSVNAGDEHAACHNSYVVSPNNTYSGYARHEIDRLPVRWLAWPLRLLVEVMGRWLESARIDRLVQVNNWLLSTNLYPADGCGDELQQVTDMLVARFPDYALCWRSLNRFSNAASIDRLASLGYLAVPSRQVWLFDGREGTGSDFLRRHNTRLDATLHKRMPYAVENGDSLEPADFERIEHLYNLLYLDKYCRLNPQFTARWMRCGQRDRWLRLRVLRDPDGRIDAVVGWLGDGALMTAPVVGYDTSLPRQRGLYRLVTQMCLQETVQRRTVLNFSSGAAHFKRLRGGRPEIEYSMVYVKHLPPATRRAWTMLSRVLHAIGVPLLRRYQL